MLGAHIGIALGADFIVFPANGMAYQHGRGVLAVKFMAR
jgi:hypothetical protein